MIIDVSNKELELIIDDVGSNLLCSSDFRDKMRLQLLKRLPDPDDLPAPELCGHGIIKVQSEHAVGHPTVIWHECQECGEPVEFEDGLFFIRRGDK